MLVPQCSAWKLLAVGVKSEAICFCRSKVLSTSSRRAFLPRQQQARVVTHRIAFQSKSEKAQLQLNGSPSRCTCKIRISSRGALVRVCTKDICRRSHCCWGREHNNDESEDCPAPHDPAVSRIRTHSTPRGDKVVLRTSFTNLYSNPAAAGLIS